MSRTVTATPPPPYFPQRTSTPTMKHITSPNISSAHFRSNHHHQNQHGGGRRKSKQLPPPSSTSIDTKKYVAEQSSTGSLHFSYENINVKKSSSPVNPKLAKFSVQYVPRNHSSGSIAENDHDDSRSISSASEELTSSEGSLSQASISSSISPLPEVGVIHDLEPKHGSSSSSKSWVPDFSKMAKAVVSTGRSLTEKKVKPGPAADLTPLIMPTTTPVSTHLASSLSREPQEVAIKDILELPKNDTFIPQAVYSRPPESYLEGLSPEERSRKEREWMDADHKRICHCAKLCSQWPMSGYNQTKFGPNGAKVFYEPQSFSNWEYVKHLLNRQAQLEQHLSTNNLNFFPARTSRSGSTCTTTTTQSQDSDSDSYDSSLPSPTTSILISADEALQAATAANLKAAMSTPLIDSANQSQVSLLIPSTPRSLVIKNNINSLTELDLLASSMMLSRDDMEVDVDSEVPSMVSSEIIMEPSTIRSTPSLGIVTRPVRAQSCGAKRPLVSTEEASKETYEEDKRRKVDDEAMVVEEAVASGVILPPSNNNMGMGNGSQQLQGLTQSRPGILPNGVSSNPRLSASTPNLGEARKTMGTMTGPGGAGAVFGHVVKTSDTHPIIISPFFPAELLPILAQHIVYPPTSSTFQDNSWEMRTTTKSTIMPKVMKSNVDVASMLLAYIPSGIPSHQGAFASGGSTPIIPSPVSSTFNFSTHAAAAAAAAAAARLQNLSSMGNLLLSSCPGKRLRMDGPVKGRGPVCRDLVTDLRRIKGEGVGCLVCCLDDAELALLGVPWETYREAAAEVGLDIVRLPMPDGFTPVSISLFDSHISMIANKYTLRGTNVLVHCRGGVGRAGLTACAWAIKMGFVQAHPSLLIVEEAALNNAQPGQHQSKQSLIPAELEHQIVMSVVERVIAMIRSRRGLKAIESFEQVQFLAAYVKWLRAGQ